MGLFVDDFTANVICLITGQAELAQSQVKQSCWRRDGDSNPEGLWGRTGFRDRLLAVRSSLRNVRDYSSSARLHARSLWPAAPSSKLIRMAKPIAEVAIPRPVDRLFDYRIPPALGDLSPGVRVLVPFGKERLVGTVVNTKSISEFSGKLQDIRECLDEQPTFSQPHLELARWISQHYLCPLGVALQAMAPQSLAQSKPSRSKVVQLACTLSQTLQAIEHLKATAPQQAMLLQRLLHTPAPTVNELLKAAGSSNGPLIQLQKKGFVAVRAKSKEPFQSPLQEHAPALALNSMQHAAVEQVKAALARGGGSFLLHGVNGSGKTEVYLHAVQHALATGKLALMLVPEISLTPQLIARARHRLGDALAVVHSGLTESQRAAEWQRLRQGHAQVLLGVRMACLLPVERLGLIVMDEEHEPTYKQDAPEPRYQAREVALQRARLERAVLILGSATPSLESFHRAQVGSLTRLELPQRVVQAPPPHVELVDMSDQKQPLSRSLERALQEVLDEQGQAILFLNRRGFGTAFCRRCRQTQRCPQCDIALIYHLRPHQLHCRYCNYRQHQQRCARCGGDLALYGFGTQQVEHSVRRRFSGARVARMDSDAIKRGQHGLLLEQFRQGRFDILLGTQMIALGHDFPHVQLVGIVDADGLLSVPDYRAAERTFQLISQAAGRAGRGMRRGCVILQTRHPDHYAIQHAAQLDYAGFAQAELSLRKDLGYPPYVHLIRLELAHPSQERCWQMAVALKDALLPLQVLGPAATVPARRHGKWQAQLMLKTIEPDSAQGALLETLKRLSLEAQVTVDVDPYGD